MTDLLSRPTRPSSETRVRRGPAGGPGRLLGRLLGLEGSRSGGSGLRSLPTSAALAALGCAASTMVLTMAVAVIGWFLADAGAHGRTTDALGVGADAWLVGHGSRLTLSGVPLGIVPLTLTGLYALALFRAGRWAAREAEPTGDDRAVVLAATVFTGLYLVVAVVTCVVVTRDSASPGLGRAVVGSLLLAGVAGTLGLAVGTGRLRVWVDRVPGWIRSVAYGAAAAVLLLVVAASALVVVSLGLHLNDVATVMSGLHLGPSDYVAYALATVAVAPNAVLLGAAYLVGPGFAVGTGTVVSSTVVTLGPVPAFPLLAALPDAGPTPSWTPALLAVPVLVAMAGAVLAQRSYRVAAYDSAALRGFGVGFVAAVLTTLVVGLAGGPMGTGRMADVGAPLGEVLVAAVAAMSLGGLVAGLVTAWWQRRTGRAADRARA